MTSETRTLLIDGDTIAFRAASACQHSVEQDDGSFQPFAVRSEGETAVDNAIQRIHDRLNATHIKVFVSCPSGDNWRYQVDPDYKSNRKDSIRPMLLEPLKQYLRDKYGAIHLPGLEADDALGVYATHPTLIEGEKIVVGRDKDFATIPGLHYQLDDDDSEGLPVIREISPLEAALNHYVQTLSGDLVDGYPGCPKVGKVRARRIVENPERLVEREGVVTRGPRKGQKVSRWVSAGPCTVWEAIVCNYAKEGLPEAEAIKTARLAKILLSEDYDLETGTVRLWVPGKE